MEIPIIYLKHSTGFIKIPWIYNVKATQIKIKYTNFILFFTNNKLCLFSKFYHMPSLTNASENVLHSYMADFQLYWLCRNFRRDHTKTSIFLFIQSLKLNNNPTNRLYVQSDKNKTFQQTRCHIC